MNKVVIILCMALASASCQTRSFSDEGNSKVEQFTVETFPELAASNEIFKQEASRFADSHFRMFDHHNRTYFKLKEMIQNNTLEKKQWTIVHFDYHSDMYRSDTHLSSRYNAGGGQTKVDIGNYINTMIMHDLVKTVWWILPDSTANETPISTASSVCDFRTQAEKDRHGPNSQKTLYWDDPRLQDWQFRDGPRDQKICVLSNKGFAFRRADQGCPAGTQRVVDFHKRTAKEVEESVNPAITGPTILDIDLDYFENSGNYSNLGSGRSPICYSLAYTPKQLEREFVRFANIVTKSMDLRPDYVAAARSPGYTFTSNRDLIYTFGQKVVGTKTGKTRQVISEGTDGWLNTYWETDENWLK